MKVFRIETFGSIDGLRQGEEPVPSPGPHQILLRMRANSLNFRDLRIIKGQPSHYDIRNRLIPVSDGAGEVAAIGTGVTRVKTGDRVVATYFPTWYGGEPAPEDLRKQRGGGTEGLLTEYAIVGEEEALPIPEHLSFEEAATLPCAAVTAWASLTEGKPLLPGETVLTQGTGGVSIFALQLAKLFGARVIATTSTDEKAARLKSLGADEVVNYITTPDWDERVKALTGRAGVDIVVEVGGDNTLARSIRATRIRGTIASVGMLAGLASGNGAPSIRGTGIALRVTTVGSREHFQAMNRAIGFHRLRPVIDRSFTFAEAAQAYRYFDARKHFGKVVITYPD